MEYTADGEVRSEEREQLLRTIRNKSIREMGKVTCMPGAENSSAKDLQVASQRAGLAG